ncbi:hypothetical protein [Lacinutrix sp. MEBiC02404]
MEILKKSVVLLLTGTINPNSFKTLVLRDPEIRKKQYIDAISYYLQNTNYNIVFTENSGVSLKEYFKEYENRIEFLVYDLPKEENEANDKGKGFKELGIIDFSIKNSIKIKQADFIVKITGRLKVLNLNALVANLIRNNKKNHEIVSCNIFKLNKMDSRCFIFTLSFWTYLNSTGKKIDLKYSFEMALWEAVINYYNNKGTFKQLIWPLRIEGVSGGFGTLYNDNLVRFTLKQIRHFFVVPYWSYKVLNIKR